MAGMVRATAMGFILMGAQKLLYKK